MQQKKFIFTLWTNDPNLARRADVAGVDRIGLDLEKIGKIERQKSLNTWISNHSLDQLSPVKEALAQAKLFCRTNPIHSSSKSEICRLLDSGVQVLMLPMFRSAKEVETFVDYVDARATVVLLLETEEAAMKIKDIVKVKGVEEIYVGLNDLSLDSGMANRFVALASEVIVNISRSVLDAGLRFGVGGIGRVNDRTLPIPSDLIYAQFPRLGATATTILSRSFLGPDVNLIDLNIEIAKSRERLDYWYSQEPKYLADAHKQLYELANRYKFI
jgi:hypothetical protein